MNGVEHCPFVPTSSIWNGIFDQTISPERRPTVRQFMRDYYFQGMKEYLMNVILRTLIVAMVPLMAVGACFYDLSQGNFKTLLRAPILVSFVLIGGTISIGSACIGVLLPPLAYKIDEFITPKSFKSTQPLVDCVRPTLGVDYRSFFMEQANTKLEEVLQEPLLSKIRDSLDGGAGRLGTALLIAAKQGRSTNLVNQLYHEPGIDRLMAILQSNNPRLHKRQLIRDLAILEMQLERLNDAEFNQVIQNFCNGQQPPVVEGQGTLERFPLLEIHRLLKPIVTNFMFYGRFTIVSEDLLPGLKIINFQAAFGAEALRTTLTNALPANQQEAYYNPIAVLMDGGRGRFATGLILAATQNKLDALVGYILLHSTLLEQPRERLLVAAATLKAALSNVDLNPLTINQLVHDFCTNQNAEESPHPAIYEALKALYGIISSDCREPFTTLNQLAGAEL